MNWGANLFDDQREQPPLSAEMFATLVLSRLRTEPSITLKGRRGMDFAVEVDGAERVANLDPYYQRYLSQPPALRAILEAFVDTLVAGESSIPADSSFEQVSPKLMPLLINSAQWQTKRQMGVRAVVRPLVEHLGMAIVVDEGREFTYVELQSIPTWKVDVSQLFDVALENLDRLAKKAPFTEIGEGERLVLIDRSLDGYAATRVLARSRQAAWSNLIQGDLVFGLPTRNLLIGFSAGHPELGLLRAQVRQDAAESEDNLFPELLTIREGQIQLFEKKPEAMNGIT